MTFTNMSNAVEELSSQRLEAKDRLLKFGISFLDDATLGILKNDLILVGARSGAGKTQFCVNVALNNVREGKKVHFLALEAEQNEIEQRILYQIFSTLYFQNKKSMYEMRVPIEQKWLYSPSYQNFITGDYDLLFPDLIKLATDELAEIKGLNTFYKSGDFDLQKFIETVMQCEAETDLIIVDHVHYFDYDDDKENSSIKEIAKTARTLALEIGKPIILVSHLRKADRWSELCPGLEEFHGSSDLFKIATKAITLAPGSFDNNRLQTFMRIVKNRHDGSVTRYLASINYLPSEGIYGKEYKIGAANQKRDDGFSSLDPINYPQWARVLTRATR